MIFINPIVELYLYLSKIICVKFVKIEQQQKDNQIIHILKCLYYVNFNLYE